VHIFNCKNETATSLPLSCVFSGSDGQDHECCGQRLCERRMMFDCNEDMLVTGKALRRRDGGGARCVTRARKLEARGT
jgi:hypothetical protein